MTSQITQQDRYTKRFSTLLEQGKRIFIPFTLLGWPNLDQSWEIIQTMIDAGVSALELGIPFSDPMADGPIIQQAGLEALENGFRVEDGFDLLKKTRDYNAEIPIGLLVYYNLILARGIEPFFKKLAELQVDGVLIADLPPESMHEVAPIAQKHGIQLILIASPLTSEERLIKIKEAAGGFLYVVSRLGITGTEERYDTELQSLITRLKSSIKLPICIGFGISTAEQAKGMVALGADGVITGSRIIQLIQDNKDAPAKSKEALANFLKQMVSI